MTTIQVRRGTAAQWATAATVLAAGELGLDTTNNILKLGDGATAWASLNPVLNNTYATKSAGYDVVVLAGQSNMAGSAGSYDANVDAVDAEVFQFAGSGTYAGQIAKATVPLNMVSSAGNSTSPGIAFANWYRRANPARRVLLVCAAMGGTPFEGNLTFGATWKNSRTDGTNLFANAVEMTQAALTTAGSGSRLIGVLWIQGETDGDNSTAGATYQTDLDTLIDGLRTSLSAPTLPFVIGAMVPEFIGTGTRTAIAAVHAATPTRKAYTAYVTGPVGLNLTGGNHYTPPAYRLLGRSMVDALTAAAANTTATGSLATAATITCVSVAPDIVTGLAANLTGTQAALTWTAPSTGGAAISDYTVQYRVSGYGPWTTWSHAASTTAASTVTGLTNGIAYDFRVAAVNANGQGSYSAQVTATAPVSTTDTFTRANSSTTMGGTETGNATWTPAVAYGGSTGVATFGISSNRATIVSVPASSNAATYIETGKSDLTISVDVVTVAGNMGIFFRATDGSHGYLVATNGIYKVTGTGAAVLLVTHGTPFASGDTMSVVLSGTTFTAKRNGSQVSTITDGTYAGTKHGLWGSGGSAGGLFDNWSSS